MNRRRPSPRSAAIVLTGGRSRRMGQDKALMEVAGRPLLAHVLAALADACAPIVAVDPEPQRLAAFDLRTVADPFPGGGPLAGLEAGLHALSADPVLLIGCDMPAFRPALVHLLRDRLGEADAVVAVVAGRPQPLGALYRQRVNEKIPALRERLPGAGLRDLLAELTVERVAEESLRRVDPTLSSFLNLNRPEDLAAFEATLRSDGSDGSDDGSSR